MNPEIQPTPPAAPHGRADSAPERDDAPSLVEAAAVLGVLLVGLASCWMLYGSLIVAMLRSMLGGGGR